MNAGPKADGTFPAKAVTILKNVGKWYGRIKESFIDTECVSPMTANRNVLLTKKGNVIYVHLYAEHKSSGVILNPMDILPQKATVLNNGRKINASVELMPTLFKDKKKYLHLWNIPVNELSNEAIVLKLEFSEKGLPLTLH